MPAEGESGARLLLTARNLGWNVVSLDQSFKLKPEQLKNSFGIFLKVFSRDIISFSGNIPVFRIEFNTRNRKQPLISLIKGQNNIDYIMDWYPTVQLTYYNPVSNPTVFYSGGKYFGNPRSEDSKYIDLWNKLDKTDYFNVFGQSKAWRNYNSYKGYIPADGESYVKEINKHGICLILHSGLHLKEGTPSGRIFEAAAAAAVIISDRNSFVVKEFGNSVLYVDLEGKDLFEQIDNHVTWIKEHPLEAQNMARLAHAIFVEKFTMEQQLSALYQKFYKIKKEHNPQY
jgi:hypothetical protein